MRIAVFSLAYHPFEGGAEIAAWEIARRLPYEFTVFTQRFGTDAFPSEKTGYVEIVRLGGGSKNLYGNNFGKFLYIFRAWRAAEARHKKQPFDRVWAIMASYGGASALLFKLRHPEIPMLLTLQEGDSETHILRRVGVFYPLWHMIFKKADCVQAISLYLADFARRHGATCQIGVIPNGVNLTKFQIPNPKSLITTSRLVYKNGVDVLIRAAAQLKKLQTSNFKLQIVGDGPLKGDLEKLAVNLGVSDVVEFKGQVPAEEIPQYLIGADIFVRPSRSEGLGNSFLEAMAAGLPVIGTPVGGITDFLKDRENGLLVKVDDPKDLAQKIRLLEDDDNLRNKIKENGQKMVLENYSWDMISEKIKEIFDSLHPTPYTLHPRILIAAGLYPPDIGGPATYTTLIEKELQKRGFKVSVLPFTEYRRMPKWERHFRYHRDLKKLAAEADMVYAQDTVSVGLPAMLAAKILRKKFVVRVAGDYAWEQSTQRFGVKETVDDFQKNFYSDPRVWILRAIQNWVVGNADLVITPSNYFKNLVSGWIKHPEKVETVYNGVERRNRVLAIRPGKTLVSIGRLVTWKGFDFLIKLMANPQLDVWKLSIIGDGPDKNRLSALIADLNLGSKVELLNARDRNILLEDLPSVGIFILNTRFESFSFQIVEAMEAAVPVIATNIGSIPELIENNEEGILVEPNNEEQILAAIKKIDDDRDFKIKIIAAARAKASQFTIEKTTNKLLEVIKSLN